MSRLPPLPTSRRPATTCSSSSTPTAFLPWRPWSGSADGRTHSPSRPDQKHASASSRGRGGLVARRGGGAAGSGGLHRRGPLGGGLLSQRSADHAERKNRSLLRRPAQGQGGRHQPDLHALQCKLPAGDRQARPGAAAAWQSRRQDVFFYSISIDPKHDTPEVLNAYAERFHVGPGWLFLTGKEEDIRLVTKKLGLSALTDAWSRDGHQPTLMVGNEATGEWMRNSAIENPKFLATMMSDF